MSGCRELSVMLDPGKDAPKKQLKVVKRDKPNLESDPGERPVDPDSVDLVEATEEEAAEDGILAQQTASAADVGSGDEESLIADIERRAKAIVGRWEVTTGTDDKIAFEFGEPKVEGDTFAGTYTFFVNDAKVESAKYVVSREEIIRFFTNGVETKNLKVTVSADGRSLTYFGNKDIPEKLARPGSRPTQQPVSPKAPNLPVEEAPKPRAVRPQVEEREQ
jgi:hypothetical protein